MAAPIPPVARPPFQPAVHVRVSIDVGLGQHLYTEHRDGWTEVYVSEDKVKSVEARILIEDLITHEPFNRFIQDWMSITI